MIYLQVKAMSQQGSLKKGRYQKQQLERKTGNQSRITSINMELLFKIRDH